MSLSTALLHPTNASFIVFMVAIAAESCIHWRFSEGLRADFPELWERSRRGTKDVWTDLDPMSAFPTYTFLRTRQYVAGSGEAAIAFCDAYRVRLLTSWRVAATAAVAFMVFWFLLGFPLFE